MQQAYAQTFDRLRRMFRARGCTAEEAADLAQDAAIRAYVHIRRWGVNGTGLDPLLNRIARNLLIDRYRRTTPHIVPLDDAGELHDPTQDPTEEVARRQRTHAVRTAIQDLPARHQTAITYSLNGLTPEEVGRRMGIGRNAADALLHRARRSLKERLTTVGEGMFGFALGVRVRWDEMARRLGIRGDVAEAAGSTVLASGVGALAATLAFVVAVSGVVSPGGSGGGATVDPSARGVVLPAAGTGDGVTASTAPAQAQMSAGGGSSSGFGAVTVGPLSRAPGSKGGSTTTVSGPEDSDGDHLFEGTIKNYGTEEPPAADPVSRTLYNFSRDLCGVADAWCDGW
ncbi:MAG: RNA polymerase sigma factor [Actinomycetota bacterium]